MPAEPFFFKTSYLFLSGGRRVESPPGLRYPCVVRPRLRVELVLVVRDANICFVIQRARQRQFLSKKMRAPETLLLRYTYYSPTFCGARQNDGMCRHDAFSAPRWPTSSLLRAVGSIAVCRLWICEMLQDRFAAKNQTKENCQLVLRRYL